MILTYISLHSCWLRRVCSSTREVTFVPCDEITCLISDDRAIDPCEALCTSNNDILSMSFYPSQSYVEPCARGNSCKISSMFKIWFVSRKGRNNQCDFLTNIAIWREIEK